MTIIEQVSLRTGLNPEKTKEVFKALFDSIVEELLESKACLIRGFGTFSVKRSLKCNIPNGKGKGATTKLPPRIVVRFQSGRGLKMKVRYKKPH